MFGRHDAFEQAHKQPPAPRARVRKSPTPTEDLRKLLVLQDAIKNCYREIAEIKKRNKVVDEAPPAPETSLQDTAADDGPDFQN